MLVSETVNYGKDAVAEIAFFAERIVRSLATPATPSINKRSNYLA